MVSVHIPLSKTFQVFNIWKVYGEKLNGYAVSIHK